MTYLKELNTEDLHNTLITFAQTLELLNNGMFPGAGHQHLTRCINHFKETHQQGVQEFVTREDADKFAPEEMKEYREKQGLSEDSVTGIQGAR